MEHLPDVEFVYVGDPMCSWCWGFAPVLDRLRERYRIPIETVVGGLRPGPGAEPMDEIARRTLAGHWSRVEEATGQPFDHAALEREHWLYDTELPAIAVVAMRERRRADTLRFFTRLQRAFYAENVDVTDPVVYPQLAEEFEVDPDEFAEALRSDEAKRAAWADFARARSLTVTGFPTLLLRIGDEHAMVTRGYLPFATLEPALTAWLGRQFGDAAAHLVAGGAAG